MIGRGAALVALLLGIGTGSGERVLPRVGGPDWLPFAFPTIEKQTEYTPVTVDTRDAVRAESRCSASALMLPVGGIDLAKTPILRWQWRVDATEIAGNHREKAGDDFPARVYVSFRFQPEKASVWKRLRRRAALVLYGSELPGNTLSYVWCPHAPAGAAWDNPFTATSQMVSLGAGAQGVWRGAEADVEADYRRRFGGEAPEMVLLAVMTDTDNGCSEATALYADFRFTPRSP